MRPRISSTYRLQLHRGFGLRDAAVLVPYLGRLGISHIYTSPLLAARAASEHGYDVVDPTRLDPKLGDDADLRLLVRALRNRGMGLVLDIVPNHMAASSENRFWEDVLRHGPASPYARWFDIDWRSPDRELRGRVLIPVLGDALPRVLARGEIRLTMERGEPRLRYHEHSFPLDPATLPRVLDVVVDAVREQLGGDALETRQLDEALAMLLALPLRHTRAPRARARRHAASTSALEVLERLAGDSTIVRAAIERAVTTFAAGPGGRERLETLLRAQGYRLAHWRRAAREINYRRFFDINELVALHQEDPEVFTETHALVLQWIREGVVDGLRVDHVDGLLDPRAYLERLAAHAREPGGEHTTFPIFVEKILAHGESLREAWPVSGTTGYDFLNRAEDVFLDPEGLAALEEVYRAYRRRPESAVAAARWGKRLALGRGLSAHVQRLTRRLLRILRGRADVASPPPGSIARAIIEVLVHLRVYRTYAGAHGPDATDRALLGAAIQAARSGGRAPDDALNQLCQLLLPAVSEPPAAVVRFAQRFQQASGPTMAKGVEDTAFYAYVPLASRNEVGGAPESPVDDAVAALHEENRRRAARWPGAMLAVTTHDTKRSADVRARLDVLTEIPDRWRAALARWRRLNRGHKRRVRGRQAPDPGTEYHLYQILLGIWPLHPDEPLRDPEVLAALGERVETYALKAAREAKLHTSWRDPDAAWEDALIEFTRAILETSRSRAFLSEVGALVGAIAPAGMWNALSRTLIHATAPGFPDFYQGDEVWNFTLVDPDNRRPVDFARRARLLDEVERGTAQPDPERAAFLEDLVHTAADGRLKLHIVRSVLAARKRHADLFDRGAYVPCEIRGACARHVVAFARILDGHCAVTLAPRLTMPLGRVGGQAPIGDAWGDSVAHLPGELARPCFECALSGTRVAVDVGPKGPAVPMGAALRRLPVALLLPAG